MEISYQRPAERVKADKVSNAERCKNEIYYPEIKKIYSNENDKNVHNKNVDEKLTKTNAFSPISSIISFPHSLIIVSFDVTNGQKTQMNISSQKKNIAQINRYSGSACLPAVL